jgi:hypothetical protein
MDPCEQEYLRKIEALLDSEKARVVIDKAVLDTKAMLDAEPERLTAAVQVSLSVFGGSLPSEIKSCRVFALRAGIESRIECHPNSHQRVLSLEGTGKISVFDTPEHYTVSLRSDTGGPLERRWGSLQENIWHQPVAGVEDWVVLTFHTASEAELIDEYKD